MAAPLSAIAIKGQRYHVGNMTKRATQRPETFDKPAHWNSDPVPKPKAAPVSDKPADGDKHGLSPTRYGDWEKDGIAIDF